MTEKLPIQNVNLIAKLIRTCTETEIRRKTENQNEKKQTLIIDVFALKTSMFSLNCYRYIDGEHHQFFY